MTDKVVFHLARSYESPTLKSYVRPSKYPDDMTIYDLYKNGLKDTEIRYLKLGWADYWMTRLCRVPTTDEQLNMPLALAAAEGVAVDLTNFLKVKRAWLVTGYPKKMLPRLEADIKHLSLYPRAGECRLEIKMENFVEVLTC